MWFWWITKSELREWVLIPVHIDELILEADMTWTFCLWKETSAERFCGQELQIVPFVTWLCCWQVGCLCMSAVAIPLVRAMLLELLHGSCRQLGPQLFNHSNSLGGLGWEEVNDGVCIVEPDLWKWSPPLGLWCLATLCYGDLYYFPDLNTVLNKWCLNALYCVPAVPLKSGNQ